MTTIVSISTLGLTAAVSVAAVVALIAFLTTKEIASTGNSSFSLRLAKFATVGILPLVMAFAVIVAIKIADIL